MATREQLDGYNLIYAPRDEDRYIKRAYATPEVTGITVHVNGRMSQERRLIRKLEDSLGSSDYTKPCSRKQLDLYDKVRSQHKKAMEHIIADLNRGLARSA